MALCSLACVSDTVQLTLRKWLCPSYSRGSAWEMLARRKRAALPQHGSCADRRLQTSNSFTFLSMLLSTLAVSKFYLSFLCASMCVCVFYPDRSHEPECGHVSTFCFQEHSAAAKLILPPDGEHIVCISRRVSSHVSIVTSLVTSLITPLGTSFVTPLLATLVASLIMTFDKSFIMCLAGPLVTTLVHVSRRPWRRVSGLSLYVSRRAWRPNPAFRNSRHVCCHA